MHFCKLMIAALQLINRVLRLLISKSNSLIVVKNLKKILESDLICFWDTSDVSGGENGMLFEWP